MHSGPAAPPPEWHRARHWARALPDSSDQQSKRPRLYSLPALIPARRPCPALPCIHLTPITPHSPYAPYAPTPSPPISTLSDLGLKCHSPLPSRPYSPLWHRGLLCERRAHRHSDPLGEVSAEERRKKKEKKGKWSTGLDLLPGRLFPEGHELAGRAPSRVANSADVALGEVLC